MSVSGVRPMRGIQPMNRAVYGCCPDDRSPCPCHSVEGNIESCELMDDTLEQRDPPDCPLRAGPVTLQLVPMDWLPGDLL